MPPPNSSMATVAALLGKTATDSRQKIAQQASAQEAKYERYYTDNFLAKHKAEILKQCQEAANAGHFSTSFFYDGYSTPRDEDGPHYLLVRALESDGLRVHMEHASSHIHTETTMTVSWPQPARL